MRMVKDTERLVVALDNMSGDEALAMVDKLQPLEVTFKVGTELFYREGFPFIDNLRQRGCHTFTDVKLHDIPNTVEKTAEVLTSRGGTFFNVHAQGGAAMMKAAGVGAVRGANAAGLEDPIILGVTLLTSISQEMMTHVLKLGGTTEDYVLYLAEMAQNAGLDGVVCSVQEVRRIRERCGKAFVLLTPGIRPASYAVKDDQARVATPKAAIEAGSSFIVVGRPITQALDPVAVTQEILDEMRSATPVSSI